jgi:hypothetical protein
MQKKRKLIDYAVVLNEKDNVATALLDMPKGDYRFSSPGAAIVITLAEDIKAGFKVAIAHILPRDTIYKYGYPIGVAREEIHPGDCVHVQNMASCSLPMGAEAT